MKMLQSFSSHGKVALPYVALLIALALIAHVPVFSSTNGVATNIVQHMANVIGMSVGVPENEYSRLAQDLKARSTELTEREKQIDAREQAFREIVIEENSKQTRFVVGIIFGITVLLVSLIGLNFYFDRKRVLGSGDNKSVSQLPSTRAHQGEFTTKL